MERNTVKFFRSFYDAAKMLPDKETQADYLMAILQYGFDGQMPETGGIAGALFLLAKPNIDASLRMSDGGRKGGQASCKPSQSLPEAFTKPDARVSQQEEGSRKKEEGRKDIGSNTPHNPPKGFDEFWRSYPKKVGKQAALKSFANAMKSTDLQTLLTAIDRQKRSAQWSRDNGQYIPNPATWLNQGRWDDELEPKKGMPAMPKESGPDDIERLERMLAK